MSGDTRIGRVLELILVLVRGLALSCRGHHELVLENLALRQQLITVKRSDRRPRVRRRDRLFWIALAATWRHWRTALVFVQPDTAMRWHREWLRRRWTRRSRHGDVGRPRTIGAEIQALVRDMAAANPLWGAPRIHGELRVLGIDISERTISRLLARGDSAPRSQTWRTFLANHLPAVVSMDFFTVPTLTGRVLFVLVLLSHERRRVINFDVTEHPCPSGLPNRSSRRSPTRRPRGGCSEITIASTARRSGAGSQASASGRSSRVQRALAESLR